MKGSSIYVFGGLITGGEYNGTVTHDIQQVDVLTGRARIVGHLSMPRALAMGSEMGGHLYILGGSTGLKTSKQVLVFNPATTLSHHRGPAAADHRRRRGDDRSDHLPAWWHLERVAREYHDRESARSLISVGLIMPIGAVTRCPLPQGVDFRVRRAMVGVAMNIEFETRFEVVLPSYLLFDGRL